MFQNSVYVLTYNVGMRILEGLFTNERVNDQDAGSKV